MRIALAGAIIFYFFLPLASRAYSVISHQAIIDAAWETDIKPLLLRRFPQATEEDLSAAQAYSYGGAIIQDMGYCQHGNHFFSDLTHYVRSGDFILALLRDANDLHEYAFALGALSHYAADSDGHRIGTNRAVPILYPQLKKKFGDSVTYEQDGLAHVKTEFGFDVLEVAKERYAPESYHDFIGFEVAQRLLDQAFRETYGLEMKDVFVNESKVINSYRWDVSKMIPKATRIAWTLKKKDIKDDLPDMTKERFLFNLSRGNYEQKWGKDYHKPTLGEKVMALLWRLIPATGSLKVLEFRTPTPQTEQMFEASFNATLEHYHRLIHEVDEGRAKLPNSNFDVGEDTGPGIYHLNDDTHALLLHKLAEHKFVGASVELRAELQYFFAGPDLPYVTKRNAKARAKVHADMEQLKSALPPALVAARIALTEPLPGKRARLVSSRRSGLRHHDQCLTLRR